MAIIVEGSKRPRVITPQDRMLGLLFLEVSRETDESARFRDAAKRGNVPEYLLRDWASGGHAGVLDIGPTGPPAGLHGMSDGDSDDEADEPEEKPAATLLKRPLPPDALLDPDHAERPLFVPAYECMDWIREAFINEGSVLQNPAHSHLFTARIGVVWTNVPNMKGGFRIAGTCEFLGNKGAVWPTARHHFQYHNWFGCVPDFLITFDADIAFRYGDRRWCALADHEVMHAGIKRDGLGPDAPPRFDKWGRPMFCLREHDSQEFVWIAGAYGYEVTGGMTKQLVEASRRRPKWTDADIARACGRDPNDPASLRPDQTGGDEDGDEEDEDEPEDEDDGGW